MPAGLSGPAELGDDDCAAVIGAGLPVDRSSLRVDDVAAGPERPLSLWRPFCCPDLGAGAMSESGPVDWSLRKDEVVVRALAVLRVSNADWYCTGAGDRAPAGTSPLAEEVAQALAEPRIFHADWRC